MKTEHIYRFTFENRPPSTMVQPIKLDQPVQRTGTHSGELPYSGEPERPSRASEQTHSGEQAQPIRATKSVCSGDHPSPVGRTPNPSSGDPEALFGRLTFSAHFPNVMLPDSREQPLFGRIALPFGRMETGPQKFRKLIFLTL